MRGGQRQALLLMRGLREAGHSSTLLARPDNPIWKAAIDGKFPVEPVGVLSLRRATAHADLVHVHDARSHSLAAIAGSKPLIVSRRVAFPVRRNLLSTWKYRRPDRFLAVSQFVASELQKAGVPDSKIEVIYDGVELAQSASPRTVSAPLAVTPDTADPQKGRALAEAAARIAGINISFSTDLARDLPQATQFIYLTYSEGLGSAALLAMSLGVPVIASRVGGLPEVVTHGETGLLVTNDPGEVASAMKTLARDPGYAAQLGRNGRARVEHTFGVQRMVDSTLSAYRKVLKCC